MWNSITSGMLNTKIFDKSNRKVREILEMQQEKWIIQLLGSRNI